MGYPIIAKVSRMRRLTQIAAEIKCAEHFRVKILFAGSPRRLLMVALSTLGYSAIKVSSRGKK